MFFRVNFRLFEDGFAISGNKPEVENREKKTSEIVCKCIERCFGIVAATLILLQMIAYM